LSATNAVEIESSYIVVLKPGLSSDQITAHHNLLYSSLFPGGIRDDGPNSISHMYGMNELQGYAGRFTDDAVDLLRQQPEVDYIEKDQLVFASELQDDSTWGLARISHRDHLGFGNYHYSYDAEAGEGVTAYVIDTGVHIKHVDFEGRAVWGATIPTNDRDVDGNGHGTHCAGTIAGKTYGVSKKATIVAVKVLRSNGSGSMSDVLKGVEWAIADHQQREKEGKLKKGSVANMSLGGGFSRALNSAVNAAVDAGISFAVAAGNENEDACNSSPASAKKAVTVGASTVKDERAWFSNHGECVDVFAPGLDIKSTWIGPSNKATNIISGTSMASPHVAGLMAYLLGMQKQVNVDTPKQIKKLINEFATQDALSKIPKHTVNKLIFNNATDEGKHDDDADLNGFELLELASRIFSFSQ